MGGSKFCRLNVEGKIGVIGFHFIERGIVTGFPQAEVIIMCR